MRLKMGAITLTLLAGSAAASAPLPLLRGHFRPDCAPYDGAAFSVTLPLPASHSQIQLRANVPLDQAVGTWQHDMQARPGHAMIVRCKTAGTGTCSYPAHGSFRIAMPTPDRMRGTIELNFAGQPQQSYRFEAQRKLPSEPVLCG